MYEIDKQTETLVKNTEYCIERKGLSTIYFRLHEIMSPEVEGKYVAVPTQLLDVHQPKEEFVARGTTEVEVINKIIALTRGIEKISDMFDTSKRTESE